MMGRRAARSAPRRRRRTAGRPDCRWSGTDRGLRARPAKSVGGPASAAKRRHAGSIELRCASNMNSKPRWTAAPGAAAITLACSRYRRSVPTAIRCQRTHRTVGHRLPYSLRVSALLVPLPSARCWRRSGNESVRSSPVIGRSHRGGRAGCPDGTQPEPLTVSRSFLRPPAGNWQAACGICPNAALPPRFFSLSPRC